MQLRLARLCLDCEEIHEEQRCPMCASETFAYISRWVPAPERRSQQRSSSPAPTPPPSRLPRRTRMVGLGIAGIGIFGLAQWLTRGRKWIEDKGEGNAGELR